MSQKQKNRQNILRIIFALAFILLTLSVTLFMFYITDILHAEPVIEAPAVTSPEQVQAQPEQAQTQPVQSGIPVRSDIDFEQLSATNADTLGYLSVPGTVIDYPVVSGVDNVKYLSTNFNGQYDVGGTVFADMFNSNNLNGPVTVLYGHYMPDDTFFTQLHNYSDAEYFEQNPNIFLYTPDVSYKYEVVAAFINDNYSLMYEKDYTDKQQLQGFIDHIANTPDSTANLKLDDVSTNDKFLALSTCLSVGTDGAHRYIVVAKLVENSATVQ